MESYDRKDRLGDHLNLRFLSLVGILVLVGALVDGYSLRQRFRSQKAFDGEVALARAEAERIREQVILPTSAKVPVGENFAEALEKFGLNSEEAADATAAAQRAFNLRQLRETINRFLADPSSGYKGVTPQSPGPRLIEPNKDNNQ